VRIKRGKLWYRKSAIEDVEQNLFRFVTVKYT